VIRRWVRRHPRLRDVLRRGRAAWWALRGADVTNGGAARGTGGATYPRRFQIQPLPTPIADDWSDPPVRDSPFRRVAAPVADPPRRYDLALFEELNAEYKTKPVVAAAPKYDAASIAERSRKRLVTVHDRIGLRNRTVLEVGCGSGYEVWHLAHQLGADAWGIDIDEREGWPALAGERVHLIAGDMADATALPTATFDRAISFTVWEHITRPLEAIAELARVMRPGGLAWIRANLYRGPTASHRYRDIHFPFPHLLFGDDVIDEAMARAGRARGGSAWVNKLTWEQYETAFVSSGFAVRSLDFTLDPLDEAFFARFEDVLGRYPRADLERGFFQVVLERR
jgi:SAM-dependent methyltransferase